VEIAQWLSTLGITVFLTKYRVPRRKKLDKHHVALQDAQRAIRLVRSQAAEFAVNPTEIGVLGFSAGGHLAALTVSQQRHESYPAIDVLDTASARPDFAILIYPAYLTVKTDSPRLDSLFAPLPGRQDYPPIYLAVAADDKFTLGSLQYLLQLHQAKTFGELHMFARGGHGTGLDARGYPFSEWTKSCARWLDDFKQGITHIRFADRYSPDP
jgi:acetyl esterase/lipase